MALSDIATKLRNFYSVVKYPLWINFFLYVSYFSFTLLIVYAKKNELKDFINISVYGDIIFYLTIVLATSWLIVKILNHFILNLYNKSVDENNKIGIIFYSMLSQALKLFVLLLLVNLALPMIPLPQSYSLYVEKLTAVLLVVTLTWIVLAMLSSIKKLVIARYENDIFDDLQFRITYTQITIIYRLSIIFVILLSAAGILMTFDKLREVGGTLLASAGVIAAIATFAAQKTLSNIFAGLQLALASPIKINDNVVVENEFGTIEDITLSHAVIRLWDFRRLVVPIVYFLEKPFQNWTYQSKNLLGTVNLYLDYTAPIPIIRDKFMSILESSNEWDKKVGKLQLTDAKEHSIEIRLLMSANDATLLWDLRCLVREKIILFINESYIHCFPRMRIDELSTLNK